MSGFEWVGEERLESCREDIKDQVKQFEHQKSKTRYLVQTMVGFLGAITVLEIVQYYMYILPQPPKSYSININDALVNQKSPSALTYEGVSLNFGMGTPNKILAVLVGLVAILLLIEFILNAWRISNYSLHEPHVESTDYNTLKKWKQENKVTMAKVDYLLSGMRKKRFIMFIPGIISLYMLQVLTGYAYFSGVLNPAFQILVIDFIVIILSLSIFIYIFYKLYRVLTDTIDPSNELAQESAIGRFRRSLRSHMHGNVGPFSAVTTLLVWEFVIYSDLIGYLIEIFQMLQYALGGLR